MFLKLIVLFYLLKIILLNLLHNEITVDVLAPLLLCHLAAVG